MRSQPTRAELQQALLESRLPLDLDTAMSIRAIAIALTNTAMALAKQRQKHQLRDRLRRHVGSADWRAMAANNDEEKS